LADQIGTDQLLSLSEPKSITSVCLTCPCKCSQISRALTENQPLPPAADLRTMCPPSDSSSSSSSSVPPQPNRAAILRRLVDAHCHPTDRHDYVFEQQKEGFAKLELGQIVS